MEPMSELRDLASLEVSPCVSLYLNTWTKEPAERERAQLFVRRRVERALLAVEDERTRDDLARVLEEARRRLASPPSRAAAIFACGAAGAFRTMDLDVPVEDELVVGTGPALRQLARLS